MAALIVRLPGGIVRRVELSRRPLTLGRSASCDIRLPGDDVSREHAEVWLDESGHVLVADKHSKNGTRVDQGEPFRDAVRTALRSIRIGGHEIELVGTPAAAEPETQVRFQHDPPTLHGEKSFFPSGRLLEVDLNQRRLELLIGLTQRIGGAFERRQLLEQALDACCEALGFERGLIALKTARGDTEMPVTRNVARDETGAYAVSRTLINKALLHGECAVVNDLAQELAGNISDSLVRYPIRSALCAPILHGAEILGVIYGDRVTTTSRYGKEDVAFLAAIARQVGTGIINLRLLTRHVELQRVLDELRQARMIQQALFPDGPLEAGGVCVAGYNQPSSHVGGDYYDYFHLGNDRIGLVIADVTGHGLPAALMMANFQAAVRVALTTDVPLEALAQRLNRHVCRNSANNMFITALLGRLDSRCGLLEIVNAGHPAPLLLSAGEVRALDDGIALPLGVEPDEHFPVQCVNTRQGVEASLWYTDGLIEAENAAGHMLCLAPVVEALRNVNEPSPERLLRAAVEVVSRHLAGTKNPDDLTLLALRCRPSDA